MDQHDTTSPADEPEGAYLRGVRLFTVALGIALSLFLTALEVSIVSTSLVTITNDLQGFDHSSWVITSYLLTYTGFLMIWSKCGDIFGVKPSLLASLFVFIAFSGGCGGAQTLNQLIICRAFQGVGAAGVYTLTLFSFVRIVPLAKYDLIAAIAAVILALGLVLGPLFGGAIDESGHWRWVFLLNLPAGALAWALLFIAMPSHFPYAPSYEEKIDSFWQKQRAFFRRVDFLGAFLVLAASMLIIAALQEGNLDYQWSSGAIITLIALSGVLWLVFVAWEWFISHRQTQIEPMLPWRMAKNRIFLGVALYVGFLLTGAPLTICVIELPQRYQTVNQSSAIGAGVKLLAYAVSNPIGTISCSILVGRLKVPFAYVIFVGAALQAVGLFLLSTIPTTTDLWLGQFGYTVLAGLGVGMCAAAFYIMVPIVVDKQDQSISLGTGLQLRMLGSALGVSIATTIMNSHLKSSLRSVLSSKQLDALLDTAEAIAQLAPEMQETVRVAYAEAYNQQMKAAGGFSLAQLLSLVLMWKREPVRLIK
ncbi:hypothetical protein ASPWEDRAFT_734149 [Aspergillus wentii DTO 134E9]|uniref:Major facilitator superfamily (MFS) profile domain-containing protein n=1 Tax=Aspergillus wentii DTO 134E9 TaxID=1073089 RepID=A0A1L9RSY0_ASPWE|nr:uncharacterized protein ASPWEDRAFT_734149 [Aspergillus wentii DTO 134E9]OJJ38042.1 hypothetical protein ASPWEDRAFT_734149 [Aspergillus wentii DTO 134E9]